jgi:hypothetical protein
LKTDKPKSKSRNSRTNIGLYYMYEGDINRRTNIGLYYMYEGNFSYNKLYYLETVYFKHNNIYNKPCQCRIMLNFPQDCKDNAMLRLQ